MEARAQCTDCAPKNLGDDAVATQKTAPMIWQI